MSKPSDNSHFLIDDPHGKTTSFGVNFSCEVDFHQLHSWVSIAIIYVKQSQFEHAFLSERNFLRELSPDLSKLVAKHEVYSLPVSDEHALLLQLKKNNITYGTIQFSVSLNQKLLDIGSKLFKHKGDRAILLYWGSTLKMETEATNFAQEQKNDDEYLISLPGQTLNLALVNCGVNITYHVQSVWLNLYRKHKHITKIFPTECERNFRSISAYMYCENYTKIGQGGNHFLFFRKYFLNYVAPPDQVPRVNKSWLEASVLCRAAGGYLPLMRDKEELTELWSLLKLSQNISYVQALYVALVKNMKKVCSISVVCF